MTADIKAILTNEKTEAQRAIIESVAEVLADMPNPMGFAFSVWDHEGYLTYCEPWPYNPNQVPGMVKANLQDFLMEESE
jgi:hypothetical protein